jgi:glycosyltransferase 2 family protein
VSRSGWARLRLAGGVAVLAVLLWRLGSGPFVEGLRTVDTTALLAGVLLAVPVTICCAYRWTLVARGLRVPLALPTAVAAYYRSQLLNTTLPGGVLGDVHRAVRHGRDAGHTGRGLRAVGWERLAGQVVQVAVALVVLVLLPSPVRLSLPVVVTGVLILGLLGWVAMSLAGGTRGGRAVHRDVRHGLLGPWLGVVAASLLAVVGHVATFVVAARTAGVTAPVAVLLPLALLVLVAMGIPANVAGWGPREGVAAWVFGAAGLGAGAGVATAVVYGVMVLVASMPGVVVLLAGRSRARPAGPEPVLEGASHG